MSDKIHIGDGVYVSFDGYRVVLESNMPTTDTIYLEREVAEALVEYIQHLLEEGVL